MAQNPFPGAASNAREAVVRLGLVGDLHFPGTNPDAKRRLLRDLDARPDLDLLVFLGDLCHSIGSMEEYRVVGELLAKLGKPFVLIPGNHDFWFADPGFFSFGWAPATPEIRRAKLDRFRRLAGRETLHFSRKIGNTLLIFLALDDPNGEWYGSITVEQRSWLALELASNRDIPTIIFCHAPIAAPELIAFLPAARNYVVQPLASMVDLLAKHPQVRLWISGHIHFAPSMPWVSGPESRLFGHLDVLHLCDLNADSVFTPELVTRSHPALWTTTLEISRNTFISRLFDHAAGAWEERFQRSFPINGV